MRRTVAAPEWLGLGEASRLLGVAPGTLRRWSDAGRVNAFTTPGGHRRYRRVTLERLLPGDQPARPLLARSGVTASRLARVYRREARHAAQGLPWLDALTDVQRDWFRTHGRLLAQSLVQHLDAESAEIAHADLVDATDQAAAYGRMAAGMSISLSQTVEGFLQFRRPFLHQLGLFANRRGLDAAATTELTESAERAMDRLLIAAMAAHSVDRVGQRLEQETETEGLR